MDIAVQLAICTLITIASQFEAYGYTQIYICLNIYVYLVQATDGCQKEERRKKKEERRKKKEKGDRIKKEGKIWPAMHTQLYR